MCVCFKPTKRKASHLTYSSTLDDTMAWMFLTHRNHRPYRMRRGPQTRMTPCWESTVQQSVVTTNSYFCEVRPEDQGGYVGAQVVHVQKSTPLGMSRWGWLTWDMGVQREPYSASKDEQNYSSSTLPIPSRLVPIQSHPIPQFDFHSIVSV